MIWVFYKQRSNLVRESDYTHFRNESLASIFDLSVPERDVAFCSLLLMDMASKGDFDKPLPAEGVHKKLHKKDKNISCAHVLDALGYAVASKKFVMRKNDDVNYPRLKIVGLRLG